MSGTFLGPPANMNKGKAKGLVRFISKVQAREETVWLWASVLQGSSQTIGGTQNEPPTHVDTEPLFGRHCIDDYTIWRTFVLRSGVPS